MGELRNPLLHLSLRGAYHEDKQAYLEYAPFRKYT